MTEGFLASYIALWILVALLTIALAALARQIGLLHRRIAPVGARIMNVGPSIGETISSFSGTDIHGRSVAIPSPDRRNTALVFVSPTCPACDQLAPALRSVAQHERSHLRVVLGSFNGDDIKNREYAIQHSLGQLEYILSPDLAHAFGILTTPYVVLIDGGGVVRSKGLVNSREHIESLFNAADDGYESIQAFQFGGQTDGTGGQRALVGVSPNEQTR